MQGCIMQPCIFCMILTVCVRIQYPQEVSQPL
jgi:hypothetical protein